MNKELKITLVDLSVILKKANIDWVLTRFVNNSSQIDDLDILVKPSSYQKVKKVVVENGYAVSSHDHALGGRIADAQVNVTKQGRVKIDLHQDFTWRKARYLSQNLIWDNLVTTQVKGVWVKVPKHEINAFLILINIIFEKTYFLPEDLQYLNKHLEILLTRKDFETQSEKHHWNNTFKYVKNWLQKSHPKTTPLFLPVWLVMYSYSEKLLGERSFNATSFLYYIFFRSRYFLNKTLPYS